MANKDKICNHSKKRGHIENCCRKKYQETKPKSAKNHKSKQESKTSIATAAINDNKGEIILAAVNREEKYVYLDDDKISDTKESILKVFISKLYSMDTTDAYQYTLVINNIKYLDGIELLEKLDDKQSKKEFIHSNNEHVNKISKFQGSIVSLVVCNETTLQPTVEALVDKDARIADGGATSHITNSSIGGANHHNMTVKTSFLLESQLTQISKWWSHTW